MLDFFGFGWHFFSPCMEISIIFLHLPSQIKELFMYSTSAHIEHSLADLSLFSCWVCSRQHHAKCVGLEKSTERFICSACQKRTQEKTIAGPCLVVCRLKQFGIKYFLSGGRKEEKPSTATPGNSFSRTPVTASYSRSGRRVTQINFANQF